MIKTILSILLIASLSACTAVPSKRGTLYWTDAGLEVLDGISTSRAIHAGGIEVGYIARPLFGKRPSDAQIALFTVAKIGMLEWSRYWHPDIRDGYQFGVLIGRPFTIDNNLRVEAVMRKRF